MRETSIPNKLSTNHKPIHGGQRVCEENKLEELELEKNEILLLILLSWNVLGL